MKFFTLMVFSLIMFSLPHLPVMAETPWQKIWLMTGEQKKLIGHGSITLTNPQSVHAKQMGTEVILIAKKPGRSFLSLGSKKIEAVVYPTKFYEAKKKLDSFIEDKWGLEIDVTPEHFIIQGKVQREEDWIEAAKIKEQYKDQIKLNITATDDILTKIKDKISNELKAKSMFSTAVEIKNSKITLVTKTKDKKELDAVTRLAEKWGFSAVELANSVELKPMIEIEITIAETKKNRLSQLGLSTPSSYSATLLPTSDLSSVANNFSPSGFKLNTQIESRLGKIIASPKLLCRSGEVAQFIAGGEIPIKIMNMRVVDVIWKKYGVILNITPQADIQKNISTKLITEISLIDEAHSIDGIPGFLTNRIETHFDVNGEKTIALSGLIKNEMGRGSQDAPLLSSIPILGELFKSKDYKENKTELIVLVTPRVISPEGESTTSAPAPSFWSEPEGDL